MGWHHSLVAVVAAVAVETATVCGKGLEQVMEDGEMELMLVTSVVMDLVKV